MRTDTNILGLSVAYFSPAGLFTRAITRALLHELDARDSSRVRKVSTIFGVLVDLVIGHRLPNDRGAIELHAANLLDQRLSYQDEGFRSNTEVNPRFVPSRTLLAVVSLRF